MKMLRSITWGLFGFAALWLAGGIAWAADEPFYKDKTIRIVVGYSPGGGFDTFSRLVGRYLSAHIPGNPSVIVMNMPGAGSKAAANRVYAMQPGDGRTIVVFNAGSLVDAVVGGKSVKFDPRKFLWLGDPAIGSLPEVLWVRSDLPVKTFEDFKNSKTPLHAGSTGVGSASTAATLFLGYLGYPIKAVMGYRGTANVMAAIERKELDARIMSQQTMQGNYRRYLQSGLVRPILSMGEEPRLKPIPGIATLKDLDLNDEQQSIADFLIGTWKLLRLFALPPGTPPDRVAILRKAFMDTLNDPELLKHAKSQNLVIAPASPETVEKTVAGLYATPQEMLDKYKEIVTKK